MSNGNLEVAFDHDQSLPAYPSRSAAEEALFAYRDRYLALLRQLAQNRTDFAPDGTPESLKALERWYFDLYEQDGFQTLGCLREDSEACLAMYFGQVAAENCGAMWVAEEFAFVPGRYEMGVQQGLLTYMLRRFADHYARADNKRRQWLYREWKKHFGRAHRACIRMG